MSDNHDIKVLSPEKWMKGWGKHYQQILEIEESELIDLQMPRPIQQLFRSLEITEKTLSELRVLELAFGAGLVSCYLASRGMNVTGVEALVTGVNAAKRIAKVHNVEEKTDFHLGDIRAWKIENNQYDIIVALQCIQYLYDSALDRLQEIAEAVKPEGFIAYSGNILPHFETEPPIRFITRRELETIFNGWDIHMIGSDEALIKPGDVRGYIWLVAQKPK